MSQLTKIERSEPRPGQIIYAVRVGVTLDGNACEWTYNLRYKEEPTQEQLDADISAQLAECDLYVQVKESVKGDSRAKYVFTDDRGKVRVMLANSFCPHGCEVRTLAQLPLVLARQPMAKRARPDVAAVLAKHGGQRN